MCFNGTFISNEKPSLTNPQARHIHRQRIEKSKVGKKSIVFTRHIAMPNHFRLTI